MGTLTDKQRSDRARLAANTRHGNADAAAAARERFDESRLQDEVLTLLKRTRTERGMALVIDDPATIAKVAEIIARGGDAA